MRNPDSHKSASKKDLFVQSLRGVRLHPDKLGICVSSAFEHCLALERNSPFFEAPPNVAYTEILS